jgi:hypothetical protein
MMSHNKFGYPRSAAIVGADVPDVYRDSPLVQEFDGKPIEATRNIDGADYDPVALAKTNRLISLATSHSITTLPEFIRIIEIELDS